MHQENPQNVCNETTFKNIYEEHAQSLQNFLYYKFGQDYNAEDTVQEAFIKLWNNCGKVTFEKAKSYLFTIVNNTTLNIIKHKKVVLKYQKTKISVHSNETPEYLMEKEEFFKRYQAALGKLTEEQRVAFLLNKAEGKKHQEIADELGVTRRVVEYRIYGAYQQLKNELENFNLK